MPTATVPKAAIDKYRQFFPGKGKVRFTRKSLVTPPAPNSVKAKG
jgi:hypothetical protein